MVICRTLPIFICIFIAGIPNIFAQEITYPQKSAHIINELTPVQLQTLKEGGQVMIREDIPRKSWPAVRIYRIIFASPEELAAVFFNYEKAHTYVPHVRTSKISKTINASTHEVDYSLSIPLMAEEKYTLRNSLRSLPGGTYQIEWNLLRATSTLASEGNFRVQPYGKDQSIICYFNFVIPGSSIAHILKGVALDQVQKSVDALINEVSKQKKQNPKFLHQQVETLHKALEQPVTQ